MDVAAHLPLEGGVDEAVAGDRVLALESRADNRRAKVPPSGFRSSVARVEMALVGDLDVLRFEALPKGRLDPRAALPPFGRGSPARAHSALPMSQQNRHLCTATPP